MERIGYEIITPTTFEEHLAFNREVPYTVRIKRFLTRDLVPLHYGKTVEILLCKDLAGELNIDGSRFRLGGKQVFVIPPCVVHSNDIEKCGGTMHIFKVSLEETAHYINLPAILEYTGTDISRLSFTCPEYDGLSETVLALIEHDHDIFMRLRCIASIFSILHSYANTSSGEGKTASALKNSALRELIAWTLGNFNKKISLAEVAKKMGYSKYYFCGLFKAMTGTTYLNYLNSVRVSHACHLLRQGKSITETCFLCGFENVSYFIQVFKRIHGLTPKEYAAAELSFVTGMV